ncbi:type II toxin-antitoxin system CcdA family antitoxin [Enterobacter sp. BNK-13]|uniref:type II toxin-antitoxin system CcdA family antitoxin n=1 Tax=Enterobacter sp. BNK-13 TaxID=3376150 RepID=UPI003B43B1C5
MSHQTLQQTVKKRTNVTITASLLSEAKASGINLSALLEDALQEKLRASRRERFLQENQAAFAPLIMLLSKKPGCFLMMKVLFDGSVRYLSQQRKRPGALSLFYGSSA